MDGLGTWRFADWRGRVAALTGARSEVGSSWFALTVLVVAVAAWTPRFSSPLPGLDPSWHAGLYMAAERGLHHGSDVAFTYGPLGPLGIDGGELWYGGPAILAVAFQAVLYLGLCTYLILALQRSVGLLLAALLAFAALVVVDTPEIVLVLAAAAAMESLRPNASARSRTALLAIGATLAAIECLIKLSLGPVIFVATLVALIGTRASAARLATFFGLVLAEVILLWLLAGQSLGDLPGYVRNARELVGGYSDGFGVTYFGGRWYVPTAAAIVASLAAGAAITAEADRRKQVSAALCVLVISFAAFKESVVRLDVPHVPIFLSTALLIWIVMPWRDHKTLLGIGAAVLAGLTLHVSSLSADADPNPVVNARRFVEAGKTMFKPSRREEISDAAKTSLRNYYDVPERALDAVDGRPVAVLPFEIAVAWAYDFEWDPLPVIQDYAAYTRRLDELNADAMSSGDGPERILRHNLGEVDGRTFAVDGRLEGWETPAQTVAEACHFEREVTTPRWQVLARIADRCGEPVEAGSIEAADGETVDVPAANGGLVVAEVHGLQTSGLGKLKALLLRGDPRYLAYDDGNVFRVTPATAADGFLVAGPKDVIGEGPFQLAPDAKTLTTFGAAGTVRFDFIRIPIVDAAATASGQRPARR